MTSDVPVITLAALLPFKQSSLANVNIEGCKPLPADDSLGSYKHKD